MLTASRVTDPAVWNSLVDSFKGHPTQQWGWGEVKGAGEWTPVRLSVSGEDGAPVGCAQVLLRPLPGKVAWLAYCPRGPQTALGREVEVLDAVAAYLRSRARIVALSVEPDWEDDSPAGQAFVAAAPGRGWHRSENTVFIPTTLVIDLTQGRDAVLAGMKKRGRYYVKQGEKAGFEVREVTTPEQLREVVEVYHGTAEHAGFGIHADEYYLTMPELMGRSCRVFGAYRDGKLHAFCWLAVSGTTAFELYGGSTETGQAEQANNMLKWAVMQQMIAEGVERYDLNGLLNDNLSVFKRQFAKHETELVGTWDLPLSPVYPAFSRALPTAQKVLRAIR